MLSNMSIKTFKPRDIDPVVLKARAKLEATRIWNSPGKTTRTFEQLYIDCLLGAATEINLINNGYKDNLKKYMDVIDPHLGITTEIKTINADRKHENYVKTAVKNTIVRCTKQKLNSIKSLNNGGSYDYGKKLMIYVYNNEVTTLHSSYIWEDNRFKPLLH